ncbi:MAG: tetratricopeptide repeat protein [Gammaproteobacteria bacterium]|jgi:predicted negative regulator of RcsB-dependent stress response
MLNNTHLSDEEQAEALKRWWTENGKSIIAGIVIGLGLVLGWQGWSSYQTEQSEMASMEYDRLKSILQNNDAAAAAIQSDTLKKDYSSTIYSFFAALDLAKNYVQAEDYVKARSELEYAIANAADDGLKALAQARLARVLIATGNYDEALAIANQNKVPAFDGDFAHIKGDVYREQGELESARKAYAEALISSNNSTLIEMKLNEVNTGS